MTLESTLLPTLAPQPPQRIAMAEISLIASSPANAWSTSGKFSALITGSSLNMRMKRRSIQSLARHTQAPSRDQPLREAMAYLSPVLMSPRNFDCGRNGFSLCSCSARCRFSASGGPWRTAKTPDLGRG